MTPASPRKQKSGRMMLYLMIGTALVISVFMVVLYPIVVETTDREANIKIPRGADSSQVRDSLAKYYGESFANRVVRLAHLRGIHYSGRYGAYTIPAGTNALGAMRKLTSGAQTPVRITVNGFRSLPLLVNRIANKLAITPDSIWSMLRDPEYVARYGLTPESAMAMFVDDTYEVYWTNSAREVLDKIGDNYLYLWSDENRRRAAEIGVTPREMMIIASITDEESNLPSEKGTIGQLYINRLHRGMRLQADPTVRFALGDFTINRITKADLKTESPYNTYLHKGVPPGPIRTTSAATVRAILEAPPHNYYYMCAKEDFSGGHNFAEDYDRHMVNAARYQKTLDQMGVTR